MAKKISYNSKRLELHKILVKILGNENAYFQPPESIKIVLPCILYTVSNVESKHANNAVYNSHKRYKLTLMIKSPESELCNKIEALPMCAFDTSYVSNGVHHHVYNIYY